MEQQVTEIYSDQIDDPQDPMRSDMDRDELFKLAENIKQNGLINPITVRPRAHPEDTGERERTDANGTERDQRVSRYEVVAGHRRFSACKIAGIIKIPCVVRDLDDAAAFAVKAAENLERVDVDPVDEGRFYREYMTRTGATVAELADRVRRSRQYVETRLAVGDLDEYMQSALKQGSMKLGVALALSEITDANLRRVWAGMAIRDGVSIAQAEHWVAGWKLNQLPGGTYDPNPPGGFEAGTPKRLLFKCALTGREDDPQMFSTVMLHFDSMPLFRTIVDEMAKENEEVEAVTSA